MKQSKAVMSDKKDGDNIVKIPVGYQTALDERQENPNESEQSLDGLDSLSDAERAWLEWFYLLPEDEKVFVESCGEKGISVTLENIDQMKKAHD